MMNTRWLLVLLLFMSAEAAAQNAQTKAEKHVYQETVFDVPPLLEIIDEMLKALRNGETEEAYNEYTSEAFRKATPLDVFIQIIKNNDVYSLNKYFQYHSFYFENGMAVFQGLLVSKTGNAVQVEFDLVKEEDKWKIFGMQLFKQEMTVIRSDN